MSPRAAASPTRRRSWRRSSQSCTALQAQQQPTSSDDTALAGEALGRATALSSALSTRFNWDRILREVSLTLPEDVWFDTLVSENPSADASSNAAATPGPVDAASAQATPNRPVSLTITGYGREQSDIVAFLARLQTVPEFSSVQLQSATRMQIDETYVIKFSVLGALK